MKRKNKIIKNIWCCRNEERFIAVSRINGNAWYIIFFGYEFWIGPGKPGFVGTDRTKNRRE